MFDDFWHLERNIAAFIPIIYTRIHVYVKKRFAFILLMNNHHLVWQIIFSSSQRFKHCVNKAKFKTIVSKKLFYALLIILLNCTKQKWLNSLYSYNMKLFYFSETSNLFCLFENESFNVNTLLAVHSLKLHMFCARLHFSWLKVSKCLSQFNESYKKSFHVIHLAVK